MKLDWKSELNWKQELLQVVLIFIFGGLVEIFLWCDTCLDDWERLRLNFIASGLFWVFLWKGSDYMVSFLNTVYSWIEYPIRRLLLSVTLVIVYTAIVAFSLHLFFDLVVFQKGFEQSFMELTDVNLTNTLIVMLGINTFMHGRGFLLQWRQVSIDMEKLKTQQALTQFQSLKNQVNPHFLFNSLNALSSLVYDDQDKAVEFIRRLSKVYRYVLDNKDEELVPVHEELAFTENFLYLQKIRFGDNLKVVLEGNSDSGYLPPLALQILAENAIKHNVISEADPLTIKVSISENECIVSNSIKEKLTKDSTGIGLNNLKERYQYLSKEELVIENNGEEFTVKLPILTLAK